jgi:hypothetical protein
LTAPNALTKRWAEAAYKRAGCSTHEEFSHFIGGAGIRTVRRWLAGEGPAGPVALMVLQEVAEGWVPTHIRAERKRRG